MTKLLRFTGGDERAYADVGGGVERDTVISVSDTLGALLLAREPQHWVEVSLLENYTETRDRREAVTGRSLPLIVREADETGVGIDLSGISSVLVVWNAGAWTAGTHDFALEHSEDDVIYETVPAELIVGTLPTIEDDNTDGQVYQVSYTGGLRFLRVNAIVTGVDPAALYGAVVVGIGPV